MYKISKGLRQDIMNLLTKGIHPQVSFEIVQAVLIQITQLEEIVEPKVEEVKPE